MRKSKYKFGYEELAKRYAKAQSELRAYKTQFVKADYLRKKLEEKDKEIMELSYLITELMKDR